MSGERAVRVLLADDEPDLRYLVRRQLESTGDFEVVAEVGDGSGAVAQAAELQPEIALVDLRMPGMSDQETIGGLVRACTSCMVAILSGRPPESEEDAARRVGAFAYYEKQSIGEELSQHMLADYALFQAALEGEDVLAPRAVTRRH